MTRLLLFSNSTPHGGPYLGRAVERLATWLPASPRVLFVPFALADHDGYTAQVQQALAPIGADVVGAHTVTPGALASADAVFVGGGNSFRLVRDVDATGLHEPLRRIVLDGLPYVGSSAGTNLACPTIRTTNDMPIVEPASFAALDLVPFQVNPHYQDPDPSSRHMGETREQRIRQFLEENDVPVLGLREGSWLEVEGERGVLAGALTARLFRRGAEPVELAAGAPVDDLLSTTPAFDAGPGGATP